MESIEYKGYRIEIEVDENPMNPREDCDWLGSLVSAHKRYNFNDKDVPYDFEDIPFDKVIALPVYLMDHSGLTFNTTGFSCKWDSGQVGWIYVEKSKVLSEWGWKKFTAKRIEQIKDLLRAEIAVFDHYHTGSVFGYQIMKGDEEIDSRWGFYGDHEESGLLGEARVMIDCHKKDTEKKEGVQQELSI